MGERPTGDCATNDDDEDVVIDELNVPDDTAAETFVGKESETEGKGKADGGVGFDVVCAVEVKAFGVEEEIDVEKDAAEVVSAKLDATVEAEADFDASIGIEFVAAIKFASMPVDDT